MQSSRIDHGPGKPQPEDLHIGMYTAPHYVTHLPTSTLSKPTSLLWRTAPYLPRRMPTRGRPLAFKQTNTMSSEVSATHLSCNPAPSHPKLRRQWNSQGKYNRASTQISNRQAIPIYHTSTSARRELLLTSRRDVQAEACTR
jgi:hypothetical protein